MVVWGYSEFTEHHDTFNKENPIYLCTDSGIIQLAKTFVVYFQKTSIDFMDI